MMSRKKESNTRESIYEYLFKKILPVVILIALIAVLILGITLYVNIKGRGGLLDLLDKEPEVEKTNIELESSLMDIAELAAEKRTFTDVYVYELAGDGVLWGKTAVFTYSGSVTAGIGDMQDMHVEFDDKNEKVYVLYPDVTILSVDVDEDSVDCVFESESIMDQFGNDDMIDMLSDCSEEQEERALEDGILTAAQNNLTRMTETLIGDILRNTDCAGYDVVVLYGEEEIPVDPGSQNLADFAKKF